jgi:hypothetical protein
MKTAIITSTKVKPRLRHMYEIYDLAAKSQCATQTWSVGVLERRKSDRRVAPPSAALPKDRCAGKSVGRNTQSSRSAPSLHPPSFHSSSRQRAGGTQARMPVRPAGFYPAEGKQASSLFGAQTWKSNVPPRPDNEPLKNGNRATACRSSIC